MFKGITYLDGVIFITEPLPTREAAQAEADKRLKKGQEIQKSNYGSTEVEEIILK
jgi:hypothetical protein